MKTDGREILAYLESGFSTLDEFYYRQMSFLAAIIFMNVTRRKWPTLKGR